MKRSERSRRRQGLPGAHPERSERSERSPKASSCYLVSTLSVASGAERSRKGAGVYLAVTLSVRARRSERSRRVHRLPEDFDPERSERSERSRRAIEPQESDGPVPPRRAKRSGYEIRANSGRDRQRGAARLCATAWGTSFKSCATKRRVVCVCVSRKSPKSSFYYRTSRWPDTGPYAETAIFVHAHRLQPVLRRGGVPQDFAERLFGCVPTAWTGEWLMRPLLEPEQALARAAELLKSRRRCGDPRRPRILHVLRL